MGNLDGVTGGSLGYLGHVAYFWYARHPSL